MEKKKTLKQRFNHGFMTVFAVVMTLMPMVSMGIWTQSTFFNDNRKVYELDYLASPEVAPFREPLVSVTFDDGWQSVYTDAAPILEKFKIPTTQFLLTGEDDDIAYLSTKQMLSLQKAGHEIGSHGVEHQNLPTLDDISLESELRDSKAEFQRRQLVGSSVIFASPFDAYNSRTIDAIGRYYYAHRNTDADLREIGPEDVNVEPRFKKYQIIGYSVTNKTTDDELRRAIAFARANKGWFVLVYHQVDTSSGKYAVTPKVFERQMQIVKDSGVKTPTMGSVLAELEVEGRI